MGPLASGQIKYPEALAAIGRFVVKRRLTDVCVLEFENGLILTGSTLAETGESYARHTETHVFSAEDLRRMIKG